ncbi:hypothetical protein FRB99_006172, partial [Tulasnella sp. 403]
METLAYPPIDVHQLCTPFFHASISSPVFDFDKEWTDNIKALREKAPRLTSEPCQPPSSSSSMQSISADPAYSSNMASYLAWSQIQPTAPPQPLQACLSAGHLSSTWPQPQSNYGLGSISPQEALCSLNSLPSSSTTLHSPTSSRGSKRSSTEASSLYATSAKRRRVAASATTGSSTSVSSSSGSSTRPPLAVTNVTDNRRNMFFLEDGDEDEGDAFRGSWEVVQGPWEVTGAFQDMPQCAPVLRIREMPKLQEPAPRLPTRVWEAIRFA